jgi:hypothetical protein
MSVKNNFNVLAFYESLDKQDRFKAENYGDAFSLVAPNSKVLPFQIIRSKSTDVLTVAKIHNVETAVELDVLTDMVQAGLRVQAFADKDYDIISNPSAINFQTLQLQQNSYYLELSDGANTWYSEVFSVVDDLTKYVKVEYSNQEQDIISFKEGHIDYSFPFKHYFYTKSTIGKPSYPFEQEAQNRDGYVFLQKQISEKKYYFVFLAPEFLCDAVRIINMHDFIKIYSGGEVYEVTDIVLDPEWLEKGNLAKVKVEFSCDTVVKNIGRGFVEPLGDFSSDFSDDFSNSNTN